MAWTKITKNYKGIHLGEESDLNKLKDFIDKNELVSFSGPPYFADWNFYLTKGKDIGSKKYFEGLPPYYDHGKFFKNKNGHVICVYQPYTPFNELKEKVENWIRGKNLNAIVLDPSHSWYYPGSSSIVIISHPSCEKVFIE